MFTTEDERREKFLLQNGTAQKTAGTGIVPPSVTDFGLDTGFRLENSLLSAKQEQETYTQLANSFIHLDERQTFNCLL